MIKAMNPIYLLLEVSATIFFMGAAMAAARRGRLPFLELISAAIFGILLEEGDQLIYGTYRYANDWVLVIDRAPLVIGLSWAIIIAGAMRITDCARPPLDGRRANGCSWLSRSPPSPS